MCGNRVEELESRVQELEASVEGLTDELVECKVRLRELEGAVDTELGFGAGTSGGEDPPEKESAEAAKSEPPETRDTQETEEQESDIIIA